MSYPSYLETERIRNEVEYLKGFLARHNVSPVKVAPAIRRAPKGPSRSWRNPALLQPPLPAVVAPPAPTKILVNPNFQQGAKILVNPNFKQPKKILVNPAFSQPTAIHVNPKLLSLPKSPRVLYKSKNKLILKKQPVAASLENKPKSSPFIFKSKNKLVRQTTVVTKKSPADRKKTRPGNVTLISGERFVSNGGTRLTRLQTIQRQAKQKSLLILSNKRKSTSLPCTIFHKLGRCPKGDACERSHLSPVSLFKYKRPTPIKGTANKVIFPSVHLLEVLCWIKKIQVAEGATKKAETRYYQTTEEQECKAVRPERSKVLGELPSFIPL
ncbi:uncharacterized protein LOC135939779 isoform X1 [Cloeon dipterum]|uniref:uncharacterized protein LOC135939779 isoform X1 n=1 Tax=Cloeon dipterum TaxID=197152 RepID=UPI0032205ADA